mmetsp:Transcript_22559/g.43807  ORF Transcript_22559/g.43807 Transcript_22559/m.43807 type:complete len:200 (-) Transcript_22559:59-658(-)
MPAHALEQPGGKDGLDLPHEGIVEEPALVERAEDVRDHVEDVAVREAAARDLERHLPLRSDALPLLCDTALLLCHSAVLCLLHALGLCELRPRDLVELLLVRAHVGQLLLLEHLHQRLLERLAHEDLQYRLNFGVKDEEVTLKDLRLPVHPRLGGHEERRRRPVHEHVGLRVHVGLDGAVLDLFQVVFSVYFERFVLSH